jgi:hypothetical protein
MTIDQFNINNLIDHPRILICAKRGSGKSWLVRDLIYRQKQINKKYVVSPTDKMNCFYKYIDILTNSISYQYNSSDLFLFIDEIAGNSNKTQSDNHLIVLDDCISSKYKLSEDKALSILLDNSNRLNTTVIMTIQYPTITQKEIIKNFDYIILLADDFLSNLKRMHGCYANVYPSFDEFKKDFYEATKDFGCMVIDMTDKKNHKIFKYTAQNVDINSKNFDGMIDIINDIDEIYDNCEETLTIKEEIDLLDKIYQL